MWPNSTVELGAIPDNEDEVKGAIHSDSTHVEPTAGMTKLFFSKFSNWTKLQKAIAWMIRYTEWIIKTFHNRDTDNDKVKNERITVEEMQKAKRCITSCVQKENFIEELRMLKSGRSIMSA